MVGQGARRQVDAGDDRRVDRPGPQGVAGLEHEVPVDPVPAMLEQHESRHALASRPTVGSRESRSRAAESHRRARSR